jgi:hypothetical protein
MTNLQTVRRNEQSLVTELSRQVEGRDPLYADLLAALGREARVLEQVIEDLDSESRAEDSVVGPSNEAAGPSRTSRPRDASEPIVDEMLEDCVEESENSQVDSEGSGGVEGASGSGGSSSGSETGSSGGEAVQTKKSKTR